MPAHEVARGVEVGRGLDRDGLDPGQRTPGQPGEDTARCELEHGGDAPLDEAGLAQVPPHGPRHLGHHTGGHLGNYARADRQYSEGDFVGKLGGPRPTIDQVMAYSSKFYPDLSGIRERSLHVGTDGGHSISWGYSNPTKNQGDVQPVHSAKSSLQLFNSIFVPMQTTQAPAPTRTPVVDRVLES